MSAESPANADPSSIIADRALKIWSDTTLAMSQLWKRSRGIAHDGDTYFKQGRNLLRENIILSGGGSQAIGNFNIYQYLLPPQTDIMPIIFQADPTEQRSKILGTMSNGSYIEEACSWITEQPQYIEWLDPSIPQSHQVLWIRGGPGKGKTFMSVHITNHLETRVRNTKAGLVIWYFFDTEIEMNNTAEAALKSMIWATCRSRPELQQIVRKGIRDRGDNGDGLTFEFWWAAFAELLKTLASQTKATTYCVLDGLDKCNQESRRKLLSKFNGLAKATGPDQRYLPLFRLLITSQSCNELHLPNTLATVLDLDRDLQDSVEKSVHQFIQQKVSHIGKTGRWSTKFRKEVCAAFEGQTRCDFLWAAFVSRQIEAAACDESNAKAILKSAEMAGPQKLQSFYGQMLKRINTRNSNSRKVAKRILRVVVCAKRPLSLAELGILLLKRESTKDIHEIAREMKSTIETHCDYMLLIGSQKNDRRRDRDAKASNTLAATDVDLLELSSSPTILADQLVTLLHPTPLRLFLEGRFKAMMAPTHSDLYERCFKCVLHCIKHPRVPNKDELPAGKDIRPYKLLDYAIRYWPSHLHLAVSNSSLEFGLESVSPEAKLFWTEQSPQRDAWLKQYWHLVMPYWTCPSQFLPIHFAAFFGLDWLVHHLFDGLNPHTVTTMANAKTSFGMTPLHWAARNGHLEVVKILLGVHKIKLNGEGYKMSPLHWAAQNNHRSVVAALLKSGANRQTKSFGMTPLHLAVHDGNAGLIRMLLKRPVDTEARIDSYGSLAVQIKTMGATLAWTSVSYQKIQNEIRAEMETNSSYIEESDRIRIAQRWTIVNTFVLLLFAYLFITYITYGNWLSLHSLLFLLGWDSQEVLGGVLITLILWATVLILYKMGLKPHAALFAIILCASWSGFLAGLAIMLVAATVCCIPDEMVTITLTMVPDVLGKWKTTFAFGACALFFLKLWEVGLRVRLHVMSLVILISIIFLLVWASIPGILVSIALTSNGEIGIKEWGSLSIPFIGFAISAFVSLVAHLVAYGHGSSFPGRLHAYVPAMAASGLSSSSLIWLRPVPHVGASKIAHITVVLLGGVWSVLGVLISVIIVETIIWTPQLLQWWYVTFWNGIHGHTALLLAIQNGYEDIVDELLNAGADIDAKDARGESAEQLARRYGQEAIAQNLEERKKIKERS